MQVLKFPFLARLTIYRTSSFALFIFALLAISSLMAISEANAGFITFDGYPQGTPITNQYVNLGAVFAGDYAPPEILILTNGEGSLTDSNGASFNISFVKPADGSTPIEISSFRWGAGCIWTSSRHTEITYFDINGNVVRYVDIAPWLGLDFPTSHPGQFHKLEFVPNGALCRIDWLDFDACLNRSDADGDGHYPPGSCYFPDDDCDDTDPAVPAPEVCWDGKDNDCNGKTDCFDMECSAESLCSPGSPDCSGSTSAYVGE